MRKVIILDDILWTTGVDMGTFFSVFFGGALLLTIIQRICIHFVVKMFGYKGLVSISVPGVVVHETGHLIFCLAFFHKVIRVRFFEVNQLSGSLGFVEHSFNPRNTYQQIGNFFIGMAPLISGSVAIYFAVKFIFPLDITAPFEPSDNYNFHLATTLFDNVSTNLSFFSNTTISLVLGLWELVKREPVFGGAVSFLLVSIAIHASPSKSDLRGALSGAISIVSLSFIANAITMYLAEVGPRQISEFIVDWRAWGVYTEIVMMNLVCFTVGLASIGCGLILTTWTFGQIVRISLSICLRRR